MIHPLINNDDNITHCNNNEKASPTVFLISQPTNTNKTNEPKAMTSSIEYKTQHLQLIKQQTLLKLRRQQYHSSDRRQWIYNCLKNIKIKCTHISNIGTTLHTKHWPVEMRMFMMRWLLNKNSYCIHSYFRSV